MGGGYLGCQSVQGKEEFTQNENKTKQQDSQAGRSDLIE